MTRREFDELVRWVEARYQGRPEALERAAASWIRLGQGGAVAWVLFLLALGGASFVGGIVLAPEFGVWLLGIGAALIVYAISQAALFLMANPPPVDGRLLRPDEAPALTAMLDGLRRELACRPFGEVRLTMDFNAGVHERPRRGFLDRPGSVLELGLPLMLALTPEEFRAVLAHEFAHLSANHGRGGRQVGRLYQTWDTLFKTLNAPKSGRSDGAVRWVVSRFFDWYWPRFRARTVVLSRFHEYQADRISAEVAGVETVASALWRIECVDAWLSDWFWIELNRQAVDQAEPPGDVLARLSAGLAAPPPADRVALWVERGLNRPTDVNNTHPAYADRVQALGRAPDGVHEGGFPPAAPQTAAAVLLGPDFATITGELSQTWRQEQSGPWRERHRRSTAEARRREKPATAAGTATEPAMAAESRAEAEFKAEPAHTADDGTSSPVEVSALWESARELVDLQGFDAALPALRAILDRDPLHAGAAVLIGHHLVNRDPSEGERLLWSVVDRRERQWMQTACESLEQHYRATGQTDRLEDVRTRLDRFDVDLAQAGRERASVSASDTLLEHGLADDQLAPLRSLLAAQPDCHGAWLARKELQHFPERPLYLLCVRSVPNRWGLSNSDRDRSLTRRLIPRVELPGQVLVITRQGTYRQLADKLRAFPGSQIHAPTAK